MYGYKKQGIMTIREAQQLVDKWIKQYGVRYFSELTNMAVLTEEVGELARVMARKYEHWRRNGRRIMGTNMPSQSNWC